MSMENGRQAGPEKALSLQATLDRVDEVLLKRMVMDERDRTAVVLWIAHTYVFDRFKHTPRLFVTSAGPAMGKSELMKLVAGFSSGGKKFDGITASAMKRLASNGAGLTLCLDQLDPMGKAAGEIARDKDDEMMNLFCSSAEVGAVTSMSARDKGSGWQPVELRIGVPTALGKIGSISNPALMSRTIVIQLVPETPAERANQTEERQKPLPPMREELQAAMAGVQRVYTKAPEGTPSRTEDIWQPLLAIARAAGARWTARAVATLEEMNAAVEKSEPVAFRLLHQAAESLGQGKWLETTIGRTELWERLRGEAGLEMTEFGMRDALAKAGVKIGVVKRGGKSVKGYMVRRILNAARRLRAISAGDGSVTPETPAVTPVTPPAGV